jgi:dephospho-CoA kinase
MTPLILIVGMPGCGKSTFIEEAQRLGYTSLSMGDIIREQTRARGLSIDRSGEVAQQLRKEQGIDAIARLTIPKIKKGQRYIIDGIRGISEVDTFKQHFDSIVIAIHSSPVSRFERLRARGREDDPSTREEFEERDRRELGFGIGDAIALADVMMINDNGIATFQRQAQLCLKEIGSYEDTKDR